MPAKMATRRLYGVLLSSVLAAAACDPQQFSGRSGITRLSIATGGTGGVYYPYGGGIAKVITDHVEGVEATAEVTAASVDNLKLLRDRKADIAFVLTDTLSDAINGFGPFADQGPIPLRTLAMLYDNYTQIVTKAGNGIERLADLRGRVVSVGAPGSGTEVIALRVLEASGIDPSADLRRQGLSATASVDALKDGKIDAFFWSGGLPTAAVLDLASTSGITAKLIANDEALDALQARYGAHLYARLVVPAHTYPGVAEAVAVVGVTNALVVHEAMDARLAYSLTRVLFDHQPELVAIHPEAAKLSPESASRGSSAPFHEGAITYYRERQVWKE